ncbi:MAG: type I DNA topoisomerase [Mariprofundaceae bacterium]|nr:type I DNA topoisomerase [Mariprofundaceae bacterium]
MHAVVVVESPAKAKTIEKYLGKGYKVLASFGHVRAFPKKNGSVDPEQDFKLTYEVISDKRKHLDQITKYLKKADKLILASDLDREGEAIAWHVYDVLNKKKALKNKTVERITFNEITRKAIKHAVDNPRDIDMALVDAQQARSALDYLVGFTLSPLLWRKIRSGLSAGRVQSVALRLVCEREDLITAFQPREYWSVVTDCVSTEGSFEARLHTLDGKKLAKFDLCSQAKAQAALEQVKAASLTIKSVKEKLVKQQPQPPFITSTLQMEAARKLGYTARKTMQLAQKLYEGIEVDGEPVGLISYMRTDAVSLSDEALDNIRDHISTNFEPEYLPSQARRFKTKSKNAQEAHEAIRPTSMERTPKQLKSMIDHDQYKLYSLIWKRTLACQMTPAQLKQVSVDIFSPDEQIMLRAAGSTLAFDGFRKVYMESNDDVIASDDEKLLPTLVQGETVDARKVTSKQHFTEPKPRFSEATLVKEMEKHGIGRPSTYASILNVLRVRDYVEMDRKRFVPTEIGQVVSRFLSQYFTNIVDSNFTAEIENKLDAVARGERQWKPLLNDFWGPFKARVDDTQENVSRADVLHEEMDENCPECGKVLMLKMGKYGRFIACSAYPECKYTRPVDDQKNEAEVEATEESCDKCGEPMVMRQGRFGKFVSCSAYPKCKNTKSMQQAEDTDVDCPKCKKGHFVKKQSRRGKVFYSCSTYPECQNALWHMPIKKACPKCEHPFVIEKVTKRSGTQHVCSVDSCSWKESIDTE